MAARPEIREFYHEYKPPLNVTIKAERLLASVPDDYLGGLSAIVLTNSSRLSHREKRRKARSRGKTYRSDRVLGRYFPAHRGAPAWIEIFIDRIFPSGSPWWLKQSLIAEQELAKTLFHEIGHHVHCTVKPEFREREDVADAWSDRLTGQYFRQRYWWLYHPVVRPFRQLVLLLTNWFLRRMEADSAAKRKARPFGRASAKS